ncbi:MAG: hypothetical protein WCW44_06485, partial [archaeon]
MKYLKWTIIILSIILVAAIIFNLERWAGDWKDLFFYQDNWIMYIFVFAMVFALSGIIKWIL